MNRALIPVIGLILVLLTSSFTHAQQGRRQRQQMPEPESLEGRYYLGASATQFHHRSIGTQGRTAKTTAVGLIFGKYLNDFIKAEWRAGTSAGSDRPSSGLEVDVDLYASAYIGVYYHWSLFSRVYGQFGISHVETSASGQDLGTTREYADLTRDYLKNSISPSFLIGTDLDFYGGTKLFLEAGRLHADTVTDIQVWQYNTGLRMDF